MRAPAGLASWAATASPPLPRPRRASRPAPRVVAPRMASASASASDATPPNDASSPDDRGAALEAWMRVGADDFDPRGVAVRRISDARGFGGVATRPIAAGDVLVVVPLTKMITSESVLRDARLGACATSLSAYQVRSIQKFFTHRSVSTFDRYPFQLTGELFLYGMALRGSR
jgi:hypothetical protein